MSGPENRPARPRPQAGHGVPNEARFGVSQVIVAGGLAYVAGQIARRPDGTPAQAATFVEHVDHAVANLDAILARVGLGRERVVWVESHVVGAPGELAQAHHRWFPPAATAGVVVPVDGLYDPVYRVEITTIALAGDAMPRTALPPDPGEPFARAVRAGDHVFVSGRHGLPDDGGPPGTPGEQLARALDRVVACVEELGGSADDVVSSHIYTARELSAQELLEVAEAHRARFAGGRNRPTSNLIGVRRLLRAEADVEVCATAVVQG